MTTEGLQIDLSVINNNVARVEGGAFYFESTYQTLLANSILSLSFFLFLLSFVFFLPFSSFSCLSFIFFFPLFLFIILVIIFYYFDD